MVPTEACLVRKFWRTNWSGWDRMVIKGQRSSKSTLGANNRLPSSRDKKKLPLHNIFLLSFPLLWLEHGIYFCLVQIYFNLHDVDFLKIDTDTNTNNYIYLNLHDVDLLVGNCELEERYRYKQQLHIFELTRCRPLSGQL